jgi:hypothetical protein
MRHDNYGDDRTRMTLRRAQSTAATWEQRVLSASVRELSLS